MKRLLFISGRWLVVGAVLVYGGDYISLRYGIPARPAFGSVMVRRSYAIPQKDRKTEFAFEPPVPETCVNALFPHYGAPPCWYLSRHQRQQVNVSAQ